ncbi:MAG: hypothetical protein ACLRM8_06350 [Alistipes sp.]
MVLYSDDFIGFLKRSKELGDQRTDVTYMERTGVSDMYEVIQWPNKLIGNISTGTIVWEQDFILYRLCAVLPMLAELRYHRKDYSGALTASIRWRSAPTAKRISIPTPRPQPSGRRSWTNLREFAEEGNVYFTLIRLGAILDYNPYRCGRAGTVRHRHVAPQPAADARVEEAMNKNNKITQTQGWS